LLVQWRSSRCWLVRLVLLLVVLVLLDLLDLLDLLEFMLLGPRKDSLCSQCYNEI
jgi:hypothetical protein